MRILVECPSKQHLMSAYKLRIDKSLSQRELALIVNSLKSIEFLILKATVHQERLVHWRTGFKILLWKIINSTARNLSRLFLFWFSVLLFFCRFIGLFFYEIDRFF